MVSPWGDALSPFTKFFTVFLVAIIGLQSVPALVVFSEFLKRLARKHLKVQQQSSSQTSEDKKNQRKILIAAQDNSTRKAIEVFFDQTPVTVESTPSAAYAIARIAQQQEQEPIVILGHAFEEQITPEDVVTLMHKCNKNIPIILVSDDRFMETLEQLRSAEIISYAQRINKQNGNKAVPSVVEYSVDGFRPIMS